MTTAQFARLSEDALALSMPDASRAQGIAAKLRQSGQWREVVAGLDSVTVLFDLLTITVTEAERALHQAFSDHAIQTAPTQTQHTIQIRYGGEYGPDMAMVLDQTGLSEAALIKAHCAVEYVVEMIGFTPGFAYLGGLDTHLSMPRLATPRTHVAAGSIGISSAYCGLYALPGPGGWPLIGRTDMTLFDRTGEQPFLIQPGDTIRFEPA